MYKIIIDSCGELTDELKKDDHFKSVPLELQLDGVRIVDDESFEHLYFFKMVENCEN